MREIGLRIDVDTFKGTRDGVPNLLKILAKHQILATFFFSVGPDNMGRHLWRLLKPAFLIKMLRSNAASLYGWDILLAGTAWPGKLIGKHLGTIIREADAQAHEIGLHAWDHHAWQAHIGSWSEQTIAHHLQLGVDTLNQILTREIDCSAAPGWRAEQRTLEIKQTLAFKYNSDCRGTAGVFLPQLKHQQLGTPQIPVDLPTFDEVIGLYTNINDFNKFILSKLLDDNTRSSSSVYTIHAEVEGLIMQDHFDELLTQAKEQNIAFKPLGHLLPKLLNNLPAGKLVHGQVAGREGWLGYKQLLNERG